MANPKPTRASKDRIRSKAGVRRKEIERLGDQFSAAAAIVHDDADLGRMARAYVKQFNDIRLGRARPCPAAKETTMPRNPKPSPVQAAMLRNLAAGLSIEHGLPADRKSALNRSTATTAMLRRGWINGDCRITDAGRAIISRISEDAA